MTLTEELNDMADRAEAAKHLQSDWTAIRLCFSRMGTSKALDKRQAQEAADPFNADASFFRAGKKLLNTKAECFRAVTAIIARARETWINATLPYTEQGVRLIRHDRLEGLTDKLKGLRAELAAAVDELADQYETLKREAEAKLGDLFNPSDYPTSIEGLYRIEWDLPSLSPPEYLKMANPKLYEEQSARIRARFDEAVTLAEETFAAELSGFIEQLQRKLNGLDDGTEKRLHETTLENLDSFFKKFSSLNIHSSAELDKVVKLAEEALSNKSLLGGKPVTRDELRNSQSIRADVRTKLAAVTATLDGLMTAAPRRAINRRKKDDQNNE